MKEWRQRRNDIRSTLVAETGKRALLVEEALLDVDVAQDDAQIQQKLQEWHDFLDPQQIFNEFSTRYADASRLPQSEQLMRWVHGKLFFEARVHPALNRLLGQRSADQVKVDLLRTLPLPSDLEPLWSKMGLP